MPEQSSTFLPPIAQIRAELEAGGDPIRLNHTDPDGHGWVRVNQDQFELFRHIPVYLAALLDVAEAARDFALCTTVLELSAAAEDYLLDDSPCGYCDGCELQAALDRLIPQVHPEES